MRLFPPKPSQLAARIIKWLDDDPNDWEEGVYLIHKPTGLTGSFHIGYSGPHAYLARPEKFTFVGADARLLCEAADRWRSHPVRGDRIAATLREGT